MKILLIEDNQQLCKSIRDYLEDEGWEVDLAHTGKEGLYLAEHTPYDAMVLDIMLPEMDGYEILRNLRTAGHRVPVILLSAAYDIDSRLRAIEHGADDFLAKPFYLQELAVRLEGVVRHSKQESGSYPVFLPAAQREIMPKKQNRKCLRYS